GVGEDLARFGDETGVAVAHEVAHARAFGIGREVVEGRAPEIVGRAVLVYDPQNLARVRDRVGRELHPDDEVNRLAVRFRHVEQTPRERAAHDLGGRVPLERQRRDLRVVPGLRERAPKALDVRLRAARREGNLRRADEYVANSHAGSGRKPDRQGGRLRNLDALPDGRASASHTCSLTLAVLYHALDRGGENGRQAGRAT